MKTYKALTERMGTIGRPKPTPDAPISSPEYRIKLILRNIAKEQGVGPIVDLLRQSLKPLDLIQIRKQLMR